MRTCAQTLGASTGAVSDTNEIRQGLINFDRHVTTRMAAGQERGTAMLSAPPLVPPSAAVGGASDPKRAAEVHKMIQCVGDATGLKPGVTSELRGMYNDSLNAQRYKQNPSMGNMLRNLF
ncbi:MAG: hypothetical protein IPG45_18540 [Deltaproteobacteria bacterium]|nr:hypothetical protein [Deltaproteobacteria bacterium]